MAPFVKLALVVDLSRSLRIFCLLLLGSAVLVTGIVIWMGPALVSLAFLDSKRNQPYTVLDLVEGEDMAAYDGMLSTILESEAGSIAAQYQLAHMLEGREQDSYTGLRVLYLEKGSDLVQVLTSSEYRNLVNDSAQVTRSAKLGSFELPVSEWPATIVVWLAELNEEGGHDPLIWLADRDALGKGRIVWKTTVTPVAGENTWQRVLVVGYQNQAQALDWLRTSDMTAARLVAKSRARAFAVMVYSR